MASNYNKEAAQLVGNLDAILPAQFFNFPAPKPEIKLMLACLEESIETLGKCKKRMEIAAQQASRCEADGCDARSTYGRNFRFDRMRHEYEVEVAWFTSGDRSYPYSFVNICEATRVSASAIRARLRASGLLPDNRRN